MIMMAPKAVLFDFDGVLCNTERLHRRAAREVLKEFGIRFTNQYYDQHTCGMDDISLFHHFFDLAGKTLSRSLCAQLLKSKHTIFMRMVQTSDIRMAGITRLLKTLKMHNVPLAIVSGSLRSEVKACLLKCELLDFFEFMVCHEDVQKTKPHPEGYLQALTRMKRHHPQITKKDCWVIEDSPTGVSAAKKAGLPVIALTSSTSAQNLSQADAVVPSLSQLQIMLF